MGCGCTLIHVSIDFLVTIKYMISHVYVKGNRPEAKLPKLSPDVWPRMCDAHSLCSDLLILQIPKINRALSSVQM